MKTTNIPNITEAEKLADFVLVNTGTEAVKLKLTYLNKFIKIIVY